MDMKIDKQVMELMMKALAGSKKYGEQQIRKREVKLWKEISIPCRLADIISRLTKSEMDSIRKNLGLKNFSGLKKKDLAGELIKQIPEHSRKAFLLFDQERYRLVKRISEHGSIVYESNLELDKVEYLREHGVIFSGLKNGEKILTMPLELLEVFRQINTPVFNKLVSRNTEWIRLSHGLLYYYGVLNLKKLEEMIEKLTGERLDTFQYIDILNDAARYYTQIKPNDAGFGFCNARVFNAQMVVQEQNARPIVDYYQFTKEQLIKAGEAGYIDRTPALSRFINFLLYHYEITREEIDEIAEQCTYMIQSDVKPGDIIGHLRTWFESSSFEEVQQLTREVMYLYNNTRMWILKGHTPQELFQEEKVHLQPLPAVPFVSAVAGAKVIDINNRIKVGRNNLCPCGSGKKYKKCCGK